MRFLEILKTSFKSIVKNKRRSFLTMIGLVIGTSAVITIFSIGQAFEKYTSTFMGLDDLDSKIMIYFNPTSIDFYGSNLESFSSNDLQQIELLEGVEAAEFFTYSSGEQRYSYETIDNLQLSNSTIKLLDSSGSKVKYGRTIEESDDVNENKVVVISEAVAKDLRKDNPESLVGTSIPINGHLFEVVGIMNDRENSGLVTTEENYVTVEMPVTTHDKYFKTSRETIAISVDKNAEVEPITKRVKTYLEKHGSVKDLGTYMSQDTGATVDQLRSILTGITLVVSAIGGISLFISGIGVMNMIYISVSERTKEIGIRRAMGATKGAIRAQFLLEGIILTFAGGTLGYLISLLFGSIASMIAPFPVTSSVSAAVLAFTLSIAIGLIFSWLPAKSAANKDIVALIR